MGELDFASIAKFFVFLLLGASMLVGLDSNFAPTSDGSMYATYTTITGFLNTGYGMLAIGALIIGTAATLLFTDYL
jgi:hypothetical protein